jgi:hypothetical protein
LLSPQAGSIVLNKGECLKGSSHDTNITNLSPMFETFVEVSD